MRLGHRAVADHLRSFGVVQRHEVVDLDRDQCPQGIRHDAAMTLRRIGLEAQQAEARTVPYEIGERLELELRFRPRQVPEKDATHLGMMAGAGGGAPVGGVPSPRRCRYSMPTSLTFAASRVFAKPGRRELATARTSTRSSIPSVFKAATNPATVAPW